MHFLLPNILDLIDILIVTYIFYKVIVLIRDSKTYYLVWALIIMVLFYFVAELANLTLLGSIIKVVRDFWFLIIIILFQQEIRSALVKLGQKSFFQTIFPPKKSFQYTELLNAIRTMSENRIGGLFVIVKEVGIDDYIMTGEIIDADISEKLILTIFNERTVLHDGAIVIQDNRIRAAKVILPLTTQKKYIKKYGTRHQAGIGISEQTDAFVIIVSEETGKISYVKDSIIHDDVTIDILSQKLHHEEEE
ncbi:MAG: diadenylate cyclase CdaA [Candidatus Cloacimonetes bacterium]|nr:diadenylate cyclase CdaA [Candidatus Cloacimonadota bacterium]MBS3766721.1 diadenylate cyclase CdaA [Candidatus Cloacimonadota bacterium]